MNLATCQRQLCVEPATWVRKPDATDLTEFLCNQHHNESVFAHHYIRLSTERTRRE
jgi:hypothetical protein